MEKAFPIVPHEANPPKQGLKPGVSGIAPIKDSPHEANPPKQGLKRHDSYLCFMRIKPHEANPPKQGLKLDSTEF